MPRAITQTFEFETISTGSTRGTVRQIDNVTYSVDDMGDESRKSARDVEELEGGLFNLGDAASVAGGMLAGMAIEAAFSAVSGAVGDVLDMNDAMNKFDARTGLTGEALEEMEDIAGRLFTRGFGENFDDVVNSMATVASITDLSGAALERTTEKALIFAEAFDVDITEAIRAADTMANIFGNDAAENFDILAGAIQQTGDPAGDLLDTFTEYSANFEELGLGPVDMLNLLNQSLEAGARNTDDIADGVREFGIRLKDGSSDLALWQLGLDGVNGLYKQGEIDGAAMFEHVMGALRDIEDPLERNRLGVELFGTKWEDAGEAAFLAMDTTSNSLEPLGDSIEKAGEALERGPQQAFERFQRTAKLALAQALGPLIERGFNVLSDILDGLPDLFNRISGAISPFIDAIVTMFTAIQTFGLDSAVILPLLYTELNKLFGPEITASIKRMIDALKDLDFARFFDEFFKGLLAGGEALWNVFNENVIQPIVEWAKSVDWAEVASTALELYEQLLAIEFALFEWALDNIVIPLATELAKVDWSSEISGVLDVVLGALMTGVETVSDIVDENIIQPLITELSNEANVQSVAEQAGVVARNIVDGLASGIGSIASWVRTNVINAIVTALTGGGDGGGRGEAGVEDAATNIGQSILDGIKSVFVGAVDFASWIMTNIIMPFASGFLGVDLTELINKGMMLADTLKEAIKANFDPLVILGWVQENIIDKIVGAITGAVDSVLNAGRALGQALLDGILEALKPLVVELIQLINDAIPNEIRFGTVLGEVRIDIPDNPIPVPSLAQGGVLDGLGFVGEEGPELAFVGQPTAILSHDKSVAALQDTFGLGGGGGTVVEQSFAGANFNFPGVRNVRDFMREMEQVANQSNQTILAPLRGTT